MTEHPNVERVKAALAAYATGDREQIAPHLAEDVVWHVGGEHALAGDYRGREAVLDYYAKVRELTGATLTLDPVAIMADDEHAAIFMHVTGQRGDVTLDTELAEALRLDSEGRWVEFWALADDQPSVDAFWRAGS